MNRSLYFNSCRAGRIIAVMATLQVATTPQPLTPEMMETVLVRGDLSQLNARQRLEYLMSVCQSVGLNPLTRPFEYIELENKLTLYATKNCTDQLRLKHGISCRITSKFHDQETGTYSITVVATARDGRSQESTGVVPLVKELGDWKKAQGSNKNYFEPNGQYRKLNPVDSANAQMKPETKAQRRATLSLCGLGGILDETELETIPHTKIEKPQVDERVLRAGRRAATIIAELERIAGEFEETAGSDRPYHEVLQANGWQSTEEVRRRPLKESHSLITALGTKLDAIQTAINEQPPTEPAA